MSEDLSNEREELRPEPSRQEARDGFESQAYLQALGPVRLPALGPPRRNRKEYLLGLSLLLLTFLTTSMAGALFYLEFRAQAGHGVSAALIRSISAHPVSFLLGNGFNLSFLAMGLPFSLALIGILLAHEMGHYLACRYYGIDSTLPYFIPIPPIISFIGTLGAFIRIRAPFSSRRALFDVAVAGPIAGFLVAVPALWFGASLSGFTPWTATADEYLVFGEPLLFKWTFSAARPDVPAGHALNLHPIAWAAWFGLLATFLNLLPVGQLDGGHIVYALFGRRSHRIASRAVLLGLAGLSLLALPLPLYLVLCVVILILGLNHPRTLNDREGLGAGRQAVGLLALLIFILCFMPVPVSAVKAGQTAFNAALTFVLSP